MAGTSPAPRDGYAYPLMQTDDRPLPSDYKGELYLCDIDNTYLVTKYKSLRDLFRLAVEPAQDKKPVPGAPALMRALRHGREGVGADKVFRRPIYFVSASPESMRKVLEKRLLLDEIEFDGASFRDLWAKKTPHLRHIRDIYGYKIAALLCYRLQHPIGAREFLFGDNLEFDAEVYTLYSRVCAGSIRGPALDGILETRGLLLKDRKFIISLADDLPEVDPVDRIFIRRVRTKTEKEQKEAPFDAADERLVDFGDFFQTALWLYLEDHLALPGLVSVAKEVGASMESKNWLSESFKEAIAAMPAELANKVDEPLKSALGLETAADKNSQSEEQSASAEPSREEND